MKENRCHLMFLPLVGLFVYFFMEKNAQTLATHLLSFFLYFLTFALFGVAHLLIGLSPFFLEDMVRLIFYQGGVFFVIAAYLYYYFCFSWFAFSRDILFYPQALKLARWLRA